MAFLESPGIYTNPLIKFPVLQSNNIEEAQYLISRSFSPHSLRIPSKHKSLSTEYHGISFGNTTLAVAQYDAKALLKPVTENHFYTQTTLKGSLDVKLGSQSFEATAGSTMVMSPTVEYDLCLHKGNSRLIAMFERNALENQLSHLLQQDLDEPLVFDWSMQGKEGYGDIWQKSLVLMCNQFSLSNKLTGKEHYLQHASEMLISLLLDMQPHNYSHLLHQDETATTPRHVQRAISYIRENIDQPISVTKLASTVGVTARALQKGFMRYAESTPSDYIRSLRIRRIHDSLLAANPCEKVSDILTKFNINSFGHFSLAYKEIYGCTPSDTLKKR